MLQQGPNYADHSQFNELHYIQTASHLNNSQSEKLREMLAQHSQALTLPDSTHQRGQGRNFSATEVDARGYRTQPARPGAQTQSRGPGGATSLAESRKTNLSCGTSGQWLEGQRLRGLPRKAAIHKSTPNQSSCPPAGRGQLGRHHWGPGGGQTQLHSLGGPGRHLKPSWLLRHSAWVPSPSQPIPAPLPQRDKG